MIQMRLGVSQSRRSIEKGLHSLAKITETGNCVRQAHPKSDKKISERVVRLPGPNKNNKNGFWK